MHDKKIVFYFWGGNRYHMDNNVFAQEGGIA